MRLIGKWNLFSDLGQNWYLYALLRRDFRLFKFSRIKDFQVTEHLFEPAPFRRTNISSTGADSRDPIALELLFAKEMKAIVAEWFGEDGVDDEDAAFSEDDASRKQLALRVYS